MNQKETILFVTVSDLSDTTGSGVATKEIISALAKNSSAEFTLICPEPRERQPEKVKKHVDDTVYMPPKKDSGVVKHAKLSLHTFLSMRRTIKQKQPDAIVARMQATLIAPATFANRYDIPYFLLARGDGYKTLRYSSVLSRIHRFNARTAEVVYAASGEIKEDTDKMKRPKQKPCKIVPNGVDKDKFKPSSIDSARKGLDLGFSEDDFVIGFVGTMHHYHAISELVESLSRVNVAKDAKLLIVGDGEQMSTIKGQVRKQGMEDSVVFTGYVPHDEVPYYISACNVTYGAIKKQSATPIKCFEYLACERPVILNEIEGMEFIRKKQCGLVIDEISPNNIAKAIDEFYRMDKTERGEMGERGRNYVVDNCTWDSLAKEVLEDIYAVVQSE